MLVALLVGLIAGWLAGLIMRGGGYGIIVDLILGLLGGFVGNWLVNDVLHIGIGATIIGQIIVATIGAVILVWITRLIKRA